MMYLNIKRQKSWCRQLILLTLLEKRDCKIVRKNEEERNASEHNQNAPQRQEVADNGHSSHRQCSTTHHV